MRHTFKILVVDDEPQVRSLLEEFLTGLGYAVQGVDDGKDALQCIQREAFDLILADLKMPKLGGLELLRKVKRAHPDLPVIMITGYPSVETAVQAMQEGAADFITKPLRFDALKAAVDKVVRQRIPGSHSPSTLAVEASRGRTLPSPLHTKIKELSILYAISEAFQAGTDSEAIFQTLVQLAHDIVGAQWSSLVVFGGKAGRTPLRTVAARGTDDCRHTGFRLTSRMLQKVIKERKPLLLKSEPASIVVPVLIKSELVGVLSVCGKEDRLPFTEDDRFLLLMLCQKAALSLENQCLYESLCQGMTETLKALVMTLEARDPYTRAHSQRVSQYATALAAKMGCTAEEQEIITVAGFLHDIGKVGIPDAVLLKTGPLTPAEYEIIKTHPVISEQIVRHVGCFSRETAIIRHHHEWWDGQGYPDGIQQHEIPAMARILIVADAFDAMTSDRPYRCGMSFKEALEELECWSGVQFDPEAVAAFRHVIMTDLPATVVMS